MPLNKEKLILKLRKQLMNPKYFLNRFRVFDESWRKSSMYTDPIHFPFYYYLGGELEAKTLCEIGFGTGLASASFLMNCKTIEDVFVFQKKNKDEYFSFRVGIANLHNILKRKVQSYYGTVNDDAFVKRFLHKTWDVILINDEMPYEEAVEMLQLAWSRISPNGIMIVDKVRSDNDMKRAYADFCQIKNREAFVFKTRYGTGILEK